MNDLMLSADPFINDSPNYPVTASKILSDMNELIIFVASLFIGDFSTGVQASNEGTGTYSYPILI